MLVPEYIHLDQTASTNTWLRSYEPSDDGKLTVVSTDYQTAGRGQGTNSWESEAGRNLLFSVLFHPQQLPAREQFILSMANALAIKAALDELTDDISIKWPNDIYWRDSKLCGTLIEATLRHGLVDRCIVGTGINVNQRLFTSDAPNPVSLWQILGHEADRKELLERVVAHLIIYIDMAEQGQWQLIRKRYHEALYLLGKPHRYRLPDGTEHIYRLEGVAPDGHVQLSEALADGSRQVRSFAFKEVALCTDSTINNT